MQCPDAYRIQRAGLKVKCETDRTRLNESFRDKTVMLIVCNFTLFRYDGLDRAAAVCYNNICF